MIPPSFNTVTIDLQALAANYRLLRQETGDAALLAMVKADGYGHGMVECAAALEEQGCTVFGVAELREAVILRQAGIGSAIYAMIGFDDGDAELFCTYDITPVVYDRAALQALSAAAVRRGRRIGVHLKVDTGMRRLGVEGDELQQLAAAVDALPHIYLAGIASHFPCADDAGSASTDECLARFVTINESFAHRPAVIRHIANSGGTLYFPRSRWDMVRCGISLYGYYPEGRKEVEDDGLRPVMSYSTRVLQVKEVPAGCGISYGYSYTTTRPTTLAVLPVGYEDGYSRLLSNRGEVLIGGRRAKIRGRICMNLCMADVTGIEGVAAGDEAVLLGSQGGEYITADEIAGRSDTISYEALCMIGNNNQRRYRE